MRCAAVLASWVLAGIPFAQAASTARLPEWVCDADRPAPSPPMLARMGARPFAFAPFYRESSGGSGGAFPGSQSRNIQVGSPPVTRGYYLYIPDDYPAGAPYPVLLALHGAGGAGTSSTNARLTRDAWSEVAQARGFIVAAPIATGSGGGWVPDRDYAAMAAILHDVAERYDIDTSRIHAAGFSAGGHVLHDIVLNQWLPDLGSDTFAGYAVSAGTMTAYACQADANPVPCAQLLADAPRRVPVALRVGNGDPYLPYVRQDRSRFLAAGWADGVDFDYAELNAGHEVVPQSFEAIWDFLCPFQRIPDAVPAYEANRFPTPDRRASNLRKLESREPDR